MQQPSTQTHRLAAAHHLGTPLAVYRASTTSSNLLYTLIGAILVGGLLVQGFRSHQWLVLLPILLIVGLLWGLLESTFWVRDLRLVVCTEGLLRLWNDEAESVRWEEIRELWRDRWGNYAFARADGTRFIVNHVFRHADELGTTIEDEVTGRLLPHLLSLYRRGEAIRFGQVQVSRQGINVGSSFLPWNMVGEVRVHGGTLTITAQGKMLQGLSVPTKGTPNLCVFEALIETILQGL